MATIQLSSKVICLLALLCLKSAVYTSLVTALELTPQMLNGGGGSGVGGGGSGESNLLKPKEYQPFSLAPDVEVELPLNVDDEANEEEVKQQLLPPWLQLPHNEQQQPQQRISSAKPFIKMPSMQQQHKHSHVHTHTHSNGERRCSIEISSKIPGICQPMAHIGSACVSGEYMEVFNAECM